MQTVSISNQVRVNRPLDETIAWCRSAEARKGWPGAIHALTRGPSELFFELDMRTRGAKPAVLGVDEHIRPVQRTGEIASFESALRWVWPEGEQSSGWAFYTFAGSPAGTDVTVEMRIILPTPTASELFIFAPFKGSIQKAVTRFVENLAQVTEPAPARGA